MRIQVTKRGWKTLAARLLLVPVISGATIYTSSTAIAQVRSGTTAVQTAAAPTNPKQLIKEGYDALKAGQFDKAQEYANSAASVRSYKWGLFDDTPDGLLKAVEAARSKADRLKSDQLLKEARSLYTKAAKTPEERFANLEQSTNYAYQAKNLHGAYSWYEFGDTPDSLISEIEVSRGKLRKQYPNLGANVVKEMGNVTKQVGATATATKTEVSALIAQSRKQLRDGMVVEAKQTAATARQLADKNRISFSSGEDSPEAVIQNCQSEGKKMIDALAKSGDSMMAKKDTGSAEAAYAKSSEIAKGLGLYSPAQEKLNSLKQKGSNAIASATTAVTTAMGTSLPTPNIPPITPAAGTLPAPSQVVTAIPAPTVPAAAGQEYLVPAVRDVKDDSKALAQAIPAPVPSTTVPATAGIGKQLLAQSGNELKRNDLGTARNLAMQAFQSDPSCKNEAEEMLRTIDAEFTAQRTRDVSETYNLATKAYHAKQYDQASTYFKLIDTTLLSATQREQMAVMLATCSAGTGKNNEIVLASGQTPPTAPATAQQPGVARVDGTKQGGTPGLAEQMNAVSDLKFAALRQEGNKAITDAMKLFGKGETDTAMQMLNEYQSKVKNSELSPARQALLIAPIEKRIENFKILKHNKDYVTAEQKDKQEKKEMLIGRGLAEEQKREEIAKAVRKIDELLKGNKFEEAKLLAMRIKQLDPDDPQVNLIHGLVIKKSRLNDYQKIANDKESLVLNGLNGAEKPGPYVDIDGPIKVDLKRADIARARGEDGYNGRTRSPAEIELDHRLNIPIDVNFENASIREIVSKLREQTKLNIAIDERAIDEAGLQSDTATVRELKLTNMSLRTVLDLALSQAKLSFINDKGVLLVTTKQRSMGRLQTKVFSVMELVTPIPDFALAPHQSMSSAIAQGKPQMPWQTAPGYGGGNNIRVPGSGLQNGELVSGAQNHQGGYTSNLVSGDVNPLAASTTMAPSLNRGAAAEKLQTLIKYMVNPQSWDENGGPGRIKYFDAGAALVVNQTADVIGEVRDLLDSLRRLQDLSVAVEVRVVSLSEAFFERIGVDFNLNVRTNNVGVERQLNTGFSSGPPFFNSLSGNGATVGYSPATGFTPDLGVPVRATSYGLSQPPFGGYQNFLSPTLNGGLSVGLAFLNDIQVFAFLEAAAGDRRTNIMQAPKITLFNGQTSTVTVSDYAYFTTGVTAFNFGGQVVFQPNNTPIPIGFAANPFTGLLGVTVTIQAVISADRRFVRMNMAPSMSGLTSANIPLFPVTVFITPVFEGGSQGQPIPFTQFYQQPSFSTIEVQTTVSVPDGGTVLLGGLKAMSEGRSEFGPPIISSIPYLNRLFKNVGVGRETRHIMIMVTPRIIINSEEEVNQTGGTGS